MREGRMTGCGPGREEDKGKVETGTDSVEVEMTETYSKEMYKCREQREGGKR